MRLYFITVVGSLAAYALLFSPTDRHHLEACETSARSSQECRLTVLGR